MYYCIMTIAGDIIYQGRSIDKATAVMNPGTVYGRAETPEKAYNRAKEQVELNQRRTKDAQSRKIFRVPRHNRGAGIAGAALDPANLPACGSPAGTSGRQD